MVQDAVGPQGFSKGVSVCPLRSPVVVTTAGARRLCALSLIGWTCWPNGPCPALPVAVHPQAGSALVAVHMGQPR